MRFVPISARLVLAALLLVPSLGSRPLLAQGPPVVIKTEKLVENVVRRSFVVGEGGSLTLPGVVFGNITVEKGGRLVLRGAVHGDVINLGGEVKVFGRVTGKVIKKGGDTFVDPQATVEGGQGF